MTPLKPTHPVTVTLSFVLALGCSSHVDVAEATGGSGTIGAASGGLAQTDGGASATIGGAGGSIVPIGGDGAGGFGVGGGGFATGGRWTDLTGGAAWAATGGVGCCATFPTCDPGDIQITPESAAVNCSTGNISCYSRGPECCIGTFYCVRNYFGAGGSGPVPATGGAPPATGGYAPTGGAPPATGGNPPATGGRPATGGKPATGGFQATGGSNAYPKPNCTYGADQTCNNYPTDTVIEGQCDQYGWCTCNSGYEINPATGKCNDHSGSVCYSPTQNIDKAYVDRAFGCKCDPATNPDPYCGIDSSGLRVRLVCIGTAWQADPNTSACN